MAQVSNERSSPWIAFLAGAIAMLAIVLILFAWWRAERAAEAFTLTLRNTPDLPTLPHMPDAPRLPDAPIPKPK